MSGRVRFENRGVNPLQVPPPGIYDRIGPEKLRELVERFYPRVKAHPLLAPIFPDDLSETVNRQEAFLTGFLGGPPLYHLRYGHPALRARHARFAITPARARAWLECMSAAAGEVDLEPEVRAELLEALARVAGALVNARDADLEPGGR